MRTYRKSKRSSRTDREYFDSLHDAESDLTLDFDGPLGEDDEVPAEAVKESPSNLNLARAIFEGCDKTRLHIEACVLANVSPEEISTVTGLNSEVITTFESHFFDFRNALDAPDFITFEAIQPCSYLKTIPEIHGVLLKRIAYFRGPLMMRQAKPYLIDGMPLFENPDATTPEGRTRLHVELALAPVLLPDHGRQGHVPALNIAHLYQELDRREAGSMGSLVENACRLLHEWAQGKQWELPQASGKEPSSRRPTTTRRGEQRARVG